MSTVSLNIIDGTRGERKRDAQGNIIFAITRTAMVKGLTSEGNAQLLEACVKCDAGGAAIDSEHPTLSGLWCVNQSPEQVSAGVVKVRLDYEEKVEEAAQILQIEGGMSSQQMSVNTGFDPTDNMTAMVPLFVEYTPTDGVADKQGGLISIDVSNETKVLTRTEYEDPAPRVRAFINHINATVWDMDPEGEAYTWKLSDVRWTSSDAGRSYRVTYTFTRRQLDDEDSSVRPGGWWDELVYMDPETGRPPADPVPTYGNGKKLVSGYYPAEFNQLGFKPNVET